MPRKLTTKAITDDAITADKIVAGAVVADIGAGTVTPTHLHSTLDLSGKTVTLPSLTDIGIGTASPAKKLHIKDAIPDIRLEDTDTNAVAEIRGNTGTGSLVLATDVNNAISNSKIIFQVDNDEKVRIDNGGNLGIGTTSAAAKLHVAKATTPAVNTNATETVAVFGVDGNEHGAIRAHATTMNSGLRAALYDTEGGSNHHGYGIHGFHTRFVDIGRADQGNYYDASNGDGRYTGGLAGNPRYQRWFAFSGNILANNTYYPIAYNLNEAKFTIEIFCGDASSRDYKKYGGYYTSPAYGVYGLDQILHVNGGWNSGTPDLRVSAPNGNLSIDLRFSSYYSTSNVASYKCIFRSFA